MTRSTRAALALLLIGSEACYTWQVQKVEPRAYVEVHQPSAIKLYGADGKSQALKAPRIEGDSIVGQAGREARSVALNDVTRFSVRRVDPVLTVLGVVGTLGVIAVIACITECQVGGPFDNMGN